MRHLAHLVDDLLDVSRVLSGRIELDARRVDLNEIARQSLLALRGDTRMQEHDVSLSVQAEPVEVLGDGTRLEQIVFNLLDNALKYTPAGGRVEMTVARDGGEGVIRVRDTGMGIAPEMLRHVFELFMRADAPLARSRARAAASGSGSRSCTAWSSCTAGGCRRPAREWAAGASSWCRCR